MSSWHRFARSYESRRTLYRRSLPQRCTSDRLRIAGTGEKATKTETARVLCAIVPILSAITARADVIEFTDKDEWIAAVRAVTTIDFTGFPPGMPIRDEFADLGVHFPDQNNRFRFGPTIFPNDEWGVDGNGDINVSFDAPLFYVAVDFPGTLAPPAAGPGAPDAGGASHAGPVAGPAGPGAYVPDAAAAGAAGRLEPGTRRPVQRLRERRLAA